MPRVLLERTFDPPVDEDALLRMSARLMPCLEQQQAEWIRSALSADGRRMLCEFEATDAETIRSALRSARLRYERVWSARLLTPESMGALLSEG